LAQAVIIRQWAPCDDDHRELVSEGLASALPRSRREHGEELIEMRHRVVGARTFGHREEQLSLPPDREDALPFPDLHDDASDRWLRWQSIVHAVVGDGAVPADCAVLGGEAPPGKGGGDGREVLLPPALAGPLLRGAVDAPVALLTLGACLGIELIEIRKVEPWTEALLDHADTPLDFAFSLRVYGRHTRGATQMAAMNAAN